MADGFMIQCEDLVYEYAREQQKRTQTSSFSVDDAKVSNDKRRSGGSAEAAEESSSADISATEEGSAGSAANTAAEAGAAEAESSVVRALDGVTFSIRKGDFTAVIGKNGSGKTTLSKCLNALFLPTSGRILVNGMDTRDDEHLWNIRQTAGMVFQDPDNQLVSSIVEDDVAFGPENLGLPSKEIRKRVDDALELVGMSDCARRAPSMLSGGQKQRIAIAGVIAMQPECIIFDEPTAMLDPKGRREVMDIILSLKEKGITIVLITHFMDEAVRADKILVMDRGRVTREGTPKEIFTDESLVRSFDADLPCGAAIAKSLRDKGMDIPAGIVTDDELLEYLLGRINGSRENGGSQH